MNWMAILFILLAGLAAWFGYRTIKNNPEMFSKVNMSKSAQTLGFLALFLIVFIAILVMLLRQ